jgi:flagellar basal body rod protein FlgG
MLALRTAATGMAAQQMNVEVISNNIANMNTVGFKKQRAEFQDLLYQTLQQAGAQSSDQGTIVPTGVQIGTGVKSGSVYRINTQGTTTATGNKFDTLSVLEKKGDNLLANTSNSQPAPAADSKVRQGMLEESNVKPILEITRMIEVSRAYEQVTRMMDSQSELTRQTITRMGRLQ